VPGEKPKDAYGGKYTHAYHEAVKMLATENPQRVAERAGAVYYAGDGYFSLTYCGEEYHITYPSGEITRVGESPEVSVSDKTLLTLYLANASGLQPLGKWISFIELPGGPHHHAPFVEDAIKPLARDLGHQPELLTLVAARMGGSSINMGDTGVVIPALPKIPLAMMLWTGDEEFPPRANLLFDSGGHNHLDTASLFVLGINVSMKVRRAARELESLLPVHETRS